MWSIFLMMEKTLPQSRSAKRCHDPVLDELARELGGETILAGMVLRQAATDLHDLRSGKPRRKGEWPMRLCDSYTELRDFFSDRWCAFLSDQIGLDPAAYLRIIEF